MLEQTLELLSAGAPNNKGDRGTAPWRFALSNPDPTVRWCPGGQAHSWLVEDLSAAGAPIEVCSPRDGQADLAIVSGSVEPTQIAAFVRAGATVLVERPSVGVPPNAAELVPAPSVAWNVLRAGGVVRGVVPADDTAASADLLRRIAGERASGGRRARLRRRLQRRGGRPLPLTTSTWHLWGEPTVPSYLATMAAAQGVDLSGHRWALWCRGDYATQKLVVFLRQAGEPAASIVVKIARDRRSHGRLANEATMLDAVQRAMPGGTDRAPRPLFFGPHGSTFVCAESMVEGEGFRAFVAETGTAAALVDDGARWLAQLGAATATNQPSDAFLEPLGEIVERFALLYEPDRTSLARLKDQLARLAELDRMPAVAVHGDAGVWNTVVHNGQLRFLDWEAAERCGPPLWDVAYFLRSGVLAIDPARNWRSRQSVLRRHLLHGSPLSTMMGSHIEAARASIGLPREAVEPLIHLCWAHRAVKESTRLTPGQRSKSAYAALTLACLRGREAKGFRTVVGA